MSRNHQRGGMRGLRRELQHERVAENKTGDERLGF